jgi:DNA-binding MarR family transcriptional regulator
MKTDRQVEQIVRGFSNHKRVAIMRLLSQEPGASVVTIARRVKCHYQTASEHVRRLHRSGLIHKRQPGQAQQHELSPRGKSVLKFLSDIR